MVATLTSGNTFARHVGVLVGGTVIAQGLLFLAAPFLTRMYTPDEFGLLTLYASILAIAVVVASLRYELAIPLPKADSEAANVVALSFGLVILMASLAAVAAAVWGKHIAAALGVQDLARFIFVIPVGVLLTGTYSVFTYWGIRTGSFARLGSSKVLQSVTTLAVQMAAFTLGGLGLLLGQTLGQMAATIWIAWFGIKNGVFRGVSRMGISQAYLRYRKFPLVSTWESLANAVSNHLPVFLITSLFGAFPAGLYGLAHRVLSVPMSLIGHAVGQVFFARAAEAYRDGSLADLVRMVCRKLSLIAGPPTVFLLLAGPEVFMWLFGSEWREAGELARWMAPWLFFNFVGSPVSTLISVLERQGDGLAFQIVLLLTRSGGLVAGVSNGDVMTAIALYSLASALCWLMFTLWLSAKSGAGILSLFHSFSVSLARSAVMALPLMVAMLFVPSAKPVAMMVWFLLVTVQYLHMLRVEKTRIEVNRAGSSNHAGSF